MDITHKENGDGSLTVTLDFDAFEVKCLKHDLPGIQGIVDWFSKGPSREKCDRCKERMIAQESLKLRAKGISLPANDTDLIDLIVSDVDYKNREQKDAMAVMS